jgi:signal transduction histidine kinase
VIRRRRPSGTVDAVIGITTPRQRLLDMAVAGALYGLACTVAVVGSTAQSLPVAARLVVVTVAVVPLVWRRRYPVTVWLLSGAATLTAMAAHGSPGPVAFAPLIALYTIATTSPRRVSLAAAAVSLAGVNVGVVAAQPSHLAAVDFAFPVVVIGACWLIGDNLRVRRAYVAELEAKAARAEVDRAAEATRAAAEERARIARELHDVVVHHVSVIAVQAGAARMLAGVDGGGARADDSPSWAAVEATARQALAELRQLLGVLRHDGEPPSRSPQPGLAQLRALIEEVRAAGLPVELHIAGSPTPVDPAVDLSAYRIVQEALTNVMKHQGCVATAVSVSYLPDTLELSVVSQPAPSAQSLTAAGPGHGLVGMRERVALLDGELQAGTQPDGGFSVRARVPLGSRQL